MIESEKKRIRKEFQPLTIAVSLKIMTPNSPANQVYNPVANEYDPDRGVTPLVILPEVIANAADGSWDMPYVNSLLAEMNCFATVIAAILLQAAAVITEIDNMHLIVIIRKVRRERVAVGFLNQCNLPAKRPEI